MVCIKRYDRKKGVVVVDDVNTKTMKTTHTCKLPIPVSNRNPACQSCLTFLNTGSNYIRKQHPLLKTTTRQQRPACYDVVNLKGKPL